MRARTIGARRLTYPILALALALPPLAVSQPAQAAPHADGDSIRQVSTAVSAEAWAAGRQLHGAQVTAHAAIEAYWTPERMRNAKPVEESPAYKAAARRFAESGGTSSAAPTNRSKPVNVPPVAGLMGAPGNSTQAINPNLGSNHPTARTNGKVFFNMDGGSWVCSGSVINSVGYNTVWTAGHCIHGGPGSSLATNWSFVPAYDDDLANPRPHGTWTARELWTWSSWIDSSNWEADMAVAIMNTRNGAHIVNQFGGHGFRTHQGFTVGINNFGYPSDAPFDGGNLMRCSGNSTKSGARIRINCDLTAGASGGPWLINWDGNWGYLNGVNSTLNSYAAPTLWWSPYFDDTASDLYTFTAPR
ncbi:serine protease [Micromonospora sp. CP22]|uniref:trypsin-like serine peptidase n=1 Tax=Micromonospora sp. CP22 TaxID=2580517 RepID=UPI0012BC0CC2|nr:hypothetical protein [Micromonospora sp. CP22]MTK03435.1 hypothetical protein [Micromonospora sp. CP22]